MSDNEWKTLAEHRVGEGDKETHTMYGCAVDDWWDWTYLRHARDTHKLTFETIDGEPTGTATIERVKDNE